MIVTDRLTDGEDSIVLGTLQVTFMGIFGMAASLLTESPSLPSSPESWGAMLFLVIICSSFGFAMQPVAQKYTTSERTAVLGALNPMGATVLGMIFLHETIGLWGIAGAGLIAAGLLFQNAQNSRALGIDEFNRQSPRLLNELNCFLIFESVILLQTRLIRTIS